ncbi:MAG: hypothetical protein JWN10_2928, partial [Solirubrobacterales bacterium]|nr:hypothetical protein [Solirubrobacterales bacterium]
VTLADLSINGTVEGNPGNRGILAGSGSLTLEGVSVSDVVTSASPAVDVTPAAGAATVGVLDSSISANASSGLYVSAATSASPSTLSVIDSTISGNTSAGGSFAGGLGFTNTDATLRDDTIANNYAAGVAGGLVVGTSSAATVTDTLLATNQSSSGGSAGDCELAPGATLKSAGHNLVGVSAPANSGCELTNGANGDLVGSASAPLNPLLGALAGNGGPTETQAPQPGSPAIGAGNPLDCEAAPVNDLDQRGDTRAAATRNACDIGAYDTGGRASTTWTVSAGTDAKSACSKPKRPFATIPGALACAHDGDTIVVGAGTFAGGFSIPASVTLTGAGAGKTVIANPTSALTAPEVTIGPDESVTLDDLSVNGEVERGIDGELEAGPVNAGIVAGSGSLTLEGVDASDFGAGRTPAVDVAPASGNAAVSVLDSTISASYSGGLAVSAAEAGRPSTLSVVNSTISGNATETASSAGLELTNTDATLRDDTITDNYGPHAGGLAIGTSSTATVTDTLLAGNHGAAPGADDCLLLGGATLAGSGHDLVGISEGTGEGCEFKNGVDGDLVGSPSAPLDPLLAPLADNGGTTETQALQPGSPAIGAGDPLDCEAAPVNDLDQRGDTRAANTRDACDIGAYDTGGA